jgi:hypothetical protein
LSLGATWTLSTGGFPCENARAMAGSETLFLPPVDVTINIIEACGIVNWETKIKCKLLF